MPTVHVDGTTHPHRLRYAGEHRAELGRDSSFLAVRQLQQDVEGFRRFTQEAAEDYKAHRPIERGDITPAYIAAKLLGRWQNGSSLVRNPHRHGPGPDNDFRFAAEDPDGLGCPRGAHIRRANPRDVLHPDLGTAVRITNRRRILRVGRPYVDKPGGTPQGMLFMCLNADIERQFELVQQAWIQSADFDGVRDETDPLLGGRVLDKDRNPKPRTFTIPTAQGPVCLRGLPDFVSTVGGGYFWMPSRAAVEFLAHIAPAPAPAPAPATSPGPAREAADVSLPA
jgi:deferrochelatase/peroxidase EfeB